MRKKQASKTVQFVNLSEDHKAEFIQFLIKNNICFQEGKENCTASIALKSNNCKSGEFSQSSKKKRVPLSNTQPNNQRLKKNRTISQKNQKNEKPSRPLKQLTPRNQPNSKLAINHRELKTPTKQNIKLNSSSLSYNKSSKSNKVISKATPINRKPVKSIQNQLPQFYQKNKTPVKSEVQQKVKLSLSKNQIQNSLQKKQARNSVKPVKKTQICRQKIDNKYQSLFQSVAKGRAVRWPLNLLERVIQQLYDDVFTRNTQCLQTKNMGNALRTIHQTSFSQQVESYFQKKFKASKIAATNLNNFLYSLSYHLSRECASMFLKTFDQFLTAKLQHEDILYYLFARNVLKRDLKAIQKMRQMSRVEGNYFAEPIRSKDISKLLRAIIGYDNQLLNQYRDLVLASMTGEFIGVYDFLRVLLDDYNQKRTQQDSDTEESQDVQLFDRDQSYNERKDQLTFGQDHEDSNYPCPKQNREQFWLCLSYIAIRDQLFELIKQKMSRKAIQFIQILASDMGKDHSQLEHLQKLLLKKAQCLIRAVFEMNKMKWFKQLGITNPSQQDISVVENIQMRYRELRGNPNGKDIAQFCKSILTTQQLVNQLEVALTTSD